jgi:hypothetical protein
MNEEQYRKLLEENPVKARFHALFQRFPPLIQEVITQKYSGIFNFYDEVGDDQLIQVCDRLEAALLLEDKRLYNLYKDII